MLDLDKAGTPDPYVERLFEGFAFSMGRLRQKIDDDLPELTEGLVSMLWPHYMRTIPSLSVVGFTPDLHNMQIAEEVPAGLEVYSRPVGPANTVCRYRTTRSMMLNPLTVQNIFLTAEPDGRSALITRFACAPQADQAQTDLKRLCLYLADDAPVSSAMHLWLTKRLEALYLRLPGSGERILRIFTNINPAGEGRQWRVGEPFPQLARRFLSNLSPYSAPGSWLLDKLRITKTRRSHYDHLMLKLHDAMKADEEYQRKGPQLALTFPAGSSWICFSDQVPHAAMGGQFMLEQTFLLPVRSMKTPEHAPLRVLENLCGQTLV
ncbi:Kdo hydroxylase family protein [Klebsiella aerogenes]